MEKTEMMKKYEAETGESREEAKERWKTFAFYSRYIAWIEAKAEAYDRIMGGGKKTLKEWANIFGLPFAVGHNGQGIAFKCKNLPIVAGLNWWPTDVGDFGFAFIDSSFIDYTGDWKDSLTLPDGWEEK